MRWEGTTGGNRHTSREVRALVRSPHCSTSPHHAGHIGWTVLLLVVLYLLSSAVWYVLVCVHCPKSAQTACLHVVWLQWTRVCGHSRKLQVCGALARACTCMQQFGKLMCIMFACTRILYISTVHTQPVQCHQCAMLKQPHLLVVVRT